MATMNISLPEEMKAWIESQAGGAKFSNTSDFMRDLVRREQERRARLEALQKLVDDGLASGPGRFESIDEIKAEARRRHAERVQPE